MEWYLPVLGLLVALSEVLALLPDVKSNSIFQLVVNLLGKLRSATE